MNRTPGYSDALVRNGRELQILCKVLEISPAAVIMTDPSGAIEYTNPAFEKATGYSAAEVLGKNPRILKSGRQGPEVYAELWKTILSGDTWTGRMENCRKDGSLYWESATISPLLGEDGKILHFIAVKQDTTDEVRAIQLSEARFRSYFDLPLHGTCITSPEKGWIEVNDRLCNMLGYGREEITRMTWAEMTHPDDLAEDVGQFQRLLSGQIEKYRLEKRFIRKDGTIIWTVISVGCVRNPDGSVNHVVCTMDDITKRKEAEEKLMRSERLLRESQETAQIGYYIFDLAVGTWESSPMLDKLFGIDRDFVRDTDGWGSLIPHEEREKTVGHLLHVLANHEPFRMDYRIIRPSDGELRWMAGYGDFERDESGKPVRLVGCIQDITERKEAEEALQRSTRRAEELAVKAEAANRAKSEFLAVMSHELRTPLNGVLGFAEILSYTQLDDQQMSYARRITESGNHLLAVVNDILDFSSIEKGHLPSLIAPVVVADLVESACLPIRKTAAEKGLEFRCEVDADVPSQITGDVRRLGQILANMLGNALKFTKSGSVGLRVATSLFGGRPSIDFSVEDTGIGISPETLDLLFKPFTQANSTMSRPFQGSGLGLAISKRLAEAMDGTVTVVSTLGMGSTFTFHLPLEIAPAARPLAPSACDRNSAAPAPAGKMVLVVEDDQINSLLIGSMLSALGYHAEFATNGAEAVKMFVPGKFFAVLMDVRMPVMDGLAATEKIRELDSEFHVPIIAITANVMPGDQARCYTAGMDAFLPKPFKRQELASTLSLFDLNFSTENQ